MSEVHRRCYGCIYNPYIVVTLVPFPDATENGYGLLWRGLVYYDLQGGITSRSDFKVS
jgi:hypothetical protein